MLVDALFRRNFFLSLSLSKFLQMKFNSWLFRYLPFSVSRLYIALMGKLYYLILWREKDLIQQTLTRVFRRKMSPKVLQARMSQAFQGIFDHYHEKLFVAYSHFPGLLRFLRRRVRFQGEEALQEALRNGQGVVLVTGHYGAVEFLPGSLALRGYPVTMICRFQTNRLRDSLRDRAGKVRLELLDGDEGNILLAALRALKEGRIVITECDEFDEWRPHPHRDLYFLNLKLKSDRTLDLLCKRSGAPVVSALMQRDGRKSYNLHLTPISNDAAPPQVTVSEQCLEVLETAIEANPEQWYQWKKFGKLIKSRLEVDHGRQESGYLAPEPAVSVADQA